jgi:hypothetical protein
MKTDAILSYWRCPTTIPQNPQNEQVISVSIA